jgi:2-oxo-3-hexenedioate decarboxylase
MTAPVWEDARVMRGLRKQRAKRDDELASGRRRIGWKTGMGGAVMERLGTTGTLVGYMTDASVVRDGATIDVSAWTNPLLEPEVAIRLGRDLEAGATREEGLAAIDALASAIEVADVDPPFEDPEALLAGNLFHRGVLLAPWDEARAGALVDGIALSVRSGDTVYADHVDPFIPIGDLGDVAVHVANVVAQMGETLSAGDVVITGTNIPPIELRSGDRIEVEHHGLGSLSLAVA